MTDNLTESSDWDTYSVVDGDGPMPTLRSVTSSMSSPSSDKAWALGKFCLKNELGRVNQPKIQTALKIDCWDWVLEGIARSRMQ